MQEAVQLGAARDHLEHGRGGAGGRRLLQRREDERHLRQGVSTYSTYICTSLLLGLFIAQGTSIEIYVE